MNVGRLCHAAAAVVAEANFSDKLVISRVSQLRVYNRGNQYILFNPTIPVWVYTNAVGAVLVKLVDGRRSVGEIAFIASENGIDRTTVVDFFDKAYEVDLFDVGEKSGRWHNRGYWKSRKIRSIYLHLTNKCNLSCSYCYRNSSPKISIKRSGEQFVTFFRSAKRLISDDACITFSGGEPMIHPDFFEVVEFTYANGWENNLLTNGTFINENNAQRICDLFKYVKISLDGPDEASHARTRGGGNFEKVLTAISALSKYASNTIVEVQMTLDRENLSDFSSVRSLIPDGVKIKYTPLLPMGRGLMHDQDERITSEEFYSINEQVEQYENRNISRLQIGQRSHGCYAGDVHLSISDNGDVFPCHLFHKSEFSFGNIFSQEVDEIFFDEKPRDFAQSMDVEHNNDRCLDCDFRYLCGGGCKANPLHKLGKHTASDTYCDFLRKTMLDDLFSGI